MKGALAVIGVALAFGLTGPAAAFALDPGVSADPDLQGEWHLDSIDQGSTPDSSRFNDNGTVVGTPTTVPDGRFGGALSFPAKGDAIDAGQVATLQPTNVSVFAWVRSSSPVPQVKNIVAQGGQDSCSYASYALYTGGSTEAAGVRFYIHANSTDYVTPPAPQTIWDGQWHAVLGTYDGSTVRLYVDGTEVGNSPATGAIQYGLDASNHFWIGDFAGGAQCTENTEFSGDIDEVRVWNRGLTAAEAAYVSSGTATTPPELPLPATTPTTTPPTTSTPTHRRRRLRPHRARRT